MQIPQFIEAQLREAGERIKSQFLHPQGISTKENESDFVTQTDKEIHLQITGEIERRFPEHSFLSEEAPEKNGSDQTWILDPLDGTSNFVSGIPLFGTMLAYCENNIVLASGIYLPMTDEYFEAQLGKGAKRNGEAIHANQKENWPNSFGCSSARINPEKKDIREALLRASNQHDFWLSCYGSSAISGCFVASGKRDWYLSKGSLVWDYAPIALLLSEAGCRVTNLSGDPWQIGDTGMLAANPALHATLLNLF